ncbi:MAG: TonB-dependent receptor [Bacteroidales bacterium]
MEFGLDMRFLNGRFGIDAALYKNWSENQIISEQLLSSTGYSNGIINIGGITHRGVELSLYRDSCKKQVILPGMLYLTGQRMWVWLISWEPIMSLLM